MKKLLLGLCLVSSSAMADCTIKCITRNPFNGKCIVKTKVCDIGTPREVVENLGREGVRLVNGVTAAWHTIYGVVPENIRTMINNHPCTIIGSYWGGLEGAALGASIDLLLQRTGVRIAQAKQHKEFMGGGGVPDWKKVIYDKGVVLVTEMDMDMTGEGQAAKQGVKDYVDGYYQQFLSCVDGAPDYNAGWVCYDTLEDQLTALLRDARRQ